MSAEVKAPMSGLILKILKKVGDSVTEDDDFLVMEALKMENTIYSPSSGTVKEILVKEGEKVEDEQVLAIVE